MARLDTMIEDLISTLNISNSPWNAWELEFIDSIKDVGIKCLSPKQVDKIEELWDKL